VLNPSLWGFKKLVTKPWPVTGAAAAASPGTINFDLKDFLQTEVVSRLFLRVVGSIIVAGAGPGAATGKDNPESLIQNINAQLAPSVGMISKNNLTPRGLLQLGIFDRGYSIHGTTIADAAATVPVDFTLPLNFKQPGSVNPIEWALPMKLFTSYPFAIQCGGREQLFSGGTNTWDPTGLKLEVWAEFETGVAGAFHAIEQFEQVIPIVATQTDLTQQLDPGFMYTHLLFIAERDNVKDDTLVNNITVQGGGRIWTPAGDGNAPMIERMTRESHVYNAAESLTGTYFVAALRDGMYTRAIDALTDKVQVKFDVTLGAGTVRQIRIHGRRIKPLALKVASA
jgi:hypothetical protein